ncbi:MAG: phosphate ABC transporter substrate-binding protein [bacterium]|nr:phosphate ABC transporter substrate-binding protein [bacterium]
MKTKIIAAIFLLVISMTGLGLETASAETLIIVNSAVAESAVDAEMIQKIFLGKTKKWEDKTAIVPVILDEGPVHDAFLDQYLNKSAKKFSTFWKKAVFTGTGTPPSSFATEAEIIAFVASNKGAIGYIGKVDAAPANVKVLVVN